MAGPFGLLGSGSSPGLLGGGFWDQMQQNRQQTLGRAPGGIPFAQNPVVTALGAALIGGKNMAGKYDFSNLGPAMGARTAMQGQIQAKQDAAEKQAQMRKAMSAALIAKSTGQPIDPEAQAMLWEANPTFAKQMFGGEAGKPVVVSKDSRLVDPATGQVIIGAAQPQSFKPLVDPASRAAFGIPEDDKTPYQVGPDNKLYRPPGGVTVNNMTGVGTPGQKKVDEAFAADFVDWERGGFSDVQKQMVQLEEAQKALESGRNLTGPDIGLQPNQVLAITNPDAIAVREAVEEVVQRNLRLILGAQFTEKEGERLIQRAFNPMLDEKENAKRLRRLIDQIKSAAEAKQAANDYFREHGTLTGWTGRMPTIADFDVGYGGTTESGIQWSVE